MLRYSDASVCCGFTKNSNHCTSDGMLFLCLTLANTVFANENKDEKKKKKCLTSCPPCCSVAASSMSWFPWEQGSVFPSRRSRDPHHIKCFSRESGSSSTGSLTLAELAAYTAVCGGGLMDCGFLFGLVGSNSSCQYISFLP